MKEKKLKIKKILSNKKSKGLVIYYIILIIFILIGFKVGCYTEEKNGGYTLQYRTYGYDYYTKKNEYSWKWVTADGFRITKYTGWYAFDFKHKTQYYTKSGDVTIELPKDSARALAWEKLPQEYKNDKDVLYSMQHDENKFEYTSKSEITKAIICIIVLAVAPIVLSILLKIFKKVKVKSNENNKLRNLKKLNELKDNGLITNEEFEKRKEKILK